MLHRRSMLRPRTKERVDNLPPTTRIPRDTTQVTKRDTHQVVTPQDAHHKDTTQDTLDNQCTPHTHSHTTNQLQFTEDKKNSDQDHTSQAHKKVTTQERVSCQARR